MAKADLKIDWATHEAAKYACVNWHYSGCVPKSKLVKVGVWEDGEFIGVVVFGVGATSALVKRYGLEMNNGCELVRVALKGHKTPVSRIMKIALKFLSESNPDLRLVVSFADPTQGHHGGIYQATNWIYSGKSAASPEYIYKGKRWQGRSFRNSFKGMENHPDVKTVMGSSKHRYLMPLDKEMAEQIKPLAKPYPKREKQAMASFPEAQRQGSTDLHAPISEGSGDGFSPLIANAS
tara:strand:+ start:275 stop:982 length:708 start_codon:yes stop_codon:yes gene_type:complete